MVSEHSLGHSLVTRSLDKDSEPWVRHPRSGCHAQTTLRLIGGKWKSPILHVIGKGEDGKRYGELKSALTGISGQVLTASLRELETDGLIERRIYAEVPPRTEYRLTATGESLDELVAAMCEWGRRYEERILKEGAL